MNDIRCESCVIWKVGDCPLLAILDLFGIDYANECEMAAAIERVLELPEYREDV